MFLADSSTDAATNAAATGAAALGVSFIFGLIFILVLMVVGMIPYYFTVKKAGYNGWLALLILVPVVGIVMMYLFAFADWPVLRGTRGLGFAAPPPFPQPGFGPPGFGPPTGGPPSVGPPTEPTPWGS